MIILLSGVINSGKTSCARLLASHFSKSAVVEADAFFSFLRFSPVSKVRDQQIIEWAPLCWKNALCAIKNLTEENFTVIVPYPLYIDDYKQLLRTFKNRKEEIYFITLNPRLDLAWGKYSKRKDKRWEQKFAQWQKNIGITNPPDGVVLDNSDLTIRKTTQTILRVINDKSARVWPKARKGV